MEPQLFETFVKDVGLEGDVEELSKELYTYAAGDFDKEVEESVFFVAFGREYSMSVEEFYRFAREFAVETWIEFTPTWISNYILEEVYKSDCNELVIEKIDTLIHRFIEWLHTLNHDKLDAELVTKLLTGEANERVIALRGLDAYLTRYSYWPYPN